MSRGKLPAGAMPVTDEEVQDVAKYYDVTPAGARLLTAMSRDGSEHLTNLQICGLADISEDTYYKLIKDERWKKAAALMAQGIIVGNAINASKALNKVANQGDVQAIKIVLETSAISQPKVVKHEHDIGINLLELYRERQGIKEPDVIDI